MAGDPHTARKLKLLDDAAGDRRRGVTDLAFRVLYYIYSAIDRRSGLAHRSHDTIAEALGASRRGVQQCIDLLRCLRYLDVETGRGKWAGDLKGNAYSIPNEVAAGETKCAPTRAFYEAGMRTKSNRNAHKTTSECAPSFAQDPFNSLDIPSRVREPAIAKALGSLPALLAARLGADVAKSWFAKAEITDVVGDTLTMGFPTKFLADHVRANFEPQLLDCCSELAPTIKFVRVVAVGKRVTGVAA